MNLTDAEIEEAMAAGQLVRNGETAQLGPACYELRMGRIYYDLTEEARRFDVGEGGKVLIKPGHRVVLITQEELRVPPDIIARIISKGSLCCMDRQADAVSVPRSWSGEADILRPAEFEHAI